MILKKMVGVTAIAGTLGFSAIGLAAGVANAAPAPQDVPGVVHHAQLDGGWGGGGGRGGGWGGPGWGGPGWWAPLLRVSLGYVFESVASSQS